MINELSISKNGKDVFLFMLTDIHVDNSAYILMNAYKEKTGIEFNKYREFKHDKLRPNGTIYFLKMII